MFTLPCSLKYSSVNESVLHFHCRLKLLLACFPFAFVQVSLWKESLEGQWVCVSDVYRGQGQETQWCFCHFLALWLEKKNILDSKKNYVQGVKYVLPLYTYSVQHRQNLLHWRIGLWCSWARMRVLLFDCVCRNRSVLTLNYVSFCAKCTCSGCDQMRNISVCLVWVLNNNIINLLPFSQLLRRSIKVVINF